MTRLTIDYGIDLGTTNSSIAVLEKNGPRVIRNNDGWYYTPSAVWIDKNSALHVGLAAKDRLVSDSDNATAEFKLWMGTTITKKFGRMQTVLSPDALSAEVLKSLKQDVKRDSGEDITAAVITVPAAFDLPQSEATKSAALSAGITVSPLLQEPIAAALAYGFDSERDNVFWLVYDFGGGTFDASVIHIRDGVIQVVNHGGDNDLGGKLIDWGLVEQLFVPPLVQQYALHDFRRGEKKWLAAFAKLKNQAEKAKIALSKETSFEISQEFVGLDDSGQPVYLDLTVTRRHVEGIVEPLLSKSIHICKQVLKEQKLKPAHIEKLILVGGPTYMPHLRETLSDPNEGLGIPLEFTKDPLTVVCQGAAIFAGTQKLEIPRSDGARSAFTLQLEYRPIGTDYEPLVGGKVISQVQIAFTGYSVRFFNMESKPPWDSGRIPVNSAGVFLLNLWAERGTQNSYQIELLDPSGRKCPVQPSSMNYTVGLTITDPPLTHNVGIAMANNKMDVFFHKGTPLPAKFKRVHKSVVALRRGDKQTVLQIPIVEGNLGMADLNRKIGKLTIHGDSINRDIPLGSDVEIKLEIDSSRLLRAFAYIPIVDQEFELTLPGLMKPQPQLPELEQDFAVQKERLKEVQRVAATADDPHVEVKLNELEKEKLVATIENALAAGTDPEAARNCEARLLDLKAALQLIEDRIEIPKMLLEAQNELDWATSVMEQHATADEKKQFELLKPELEQAMNAKNGERLRDKIDQMNQLRLRVEARTPDFWLGYRTYLLEHQSSMTDQTQARLWFTHADRAINSGDIGALKTACNQLWALLPKSEQSRKGYGGGTVATSA